MRNQSLRGALAYLVQVEDSSNEPSQGRQRSAAASGSGGELLALVKTALWTAIALACAYGLSRLSDAQPLF